MRVLIACEYSASVRDAFRALGHDAWSCDLLPCEKDARWHIQGDVLALLKMDWDLMVAHPPCTHLAVSGARWFPAKRADGSQQKAVDFFMALASAPIERIAIENPVCIMSRRWREPDQVIQPWWFGHAETKATCLWLKNLPLLVPTNPVEPDYMRNPDGSFKLDKKGKRYSRIHFMSGRMKDTERWKERSRTYTGVAAAMAAQWSIPSPVQLELTA